jgi:DNA helicase-2/ATP-dependent DNA helicase PcrA
MDLTANLNPRQAQAVTGGDGPLLVLAGAGSGKTKVLTSRIAYLLMEKNVPANRILAITFTNKAAKEMRQRVEGVLPEAAHHLWLHTFHGACLRMLRSQGEFFGRNRNFVIYNADDQLTLVKDCLKELNLDDKTWPPRSVQWSISQSKNQLCDAADFTRQAYDEYSKKVAQVFHLYSNKLKSYNAVDFDDLIMLTVQLLKENPQVLAHYQERFRYILIDEYQDTNHAQYILVNLLAAGHRNLFVVGDPDQGIYGWRGADINNIMSFERDYPEAQTITLDQNYRSTSVILETANAVIRNNPRRQEKKLWSAIEGGAPLLVCCGNDERDEADYVAGQILYLVKMENRHYRDFAVLFRTHAQSRVLEEVFVRNGLPYTIVGGLKFYDRKEVKDTLAYIRII